MVVSRSLVLSLLLVTSACATKRPDSTSGFVVMSAEASKTTVLHPGDTLRELGASLLSNAQRDVLRNVAARIQAPPDCARAFKRDTIVLLHIVPVCGREPKDDDYLKDWANLVVGSKGQVIDSGPRVAWSLGTLCPSGRTVEGEPYYGGVWLLDGCARMHPERPTGELTPGVATSLGVILPEAVQRGILQQCSRDVPARADFEWVPSVQQIAELEQRLPEYISRNGQLPAPLSSYKRQYGGFGVGRDSLIYVNLWIPWREDTASYWHRVPVQICDGGKAVFGVVYDVRRHRFTRIDFNGYA